MKMKNITQILLVVLTGAGFSQSALELGESAFKNRAIGSVEDKAAPSPIENAISHLEEAIKNPKVEKEAALALMKCVYFHGKFIGENEKAQKKSFQKGKDLGEKYIAEYPNSAPFRYWYLVNLGSWSEVYGILTAAKEGVADLMKDHSEKIIALDPQYEDGGGYFMLGAVHYKSPYIPFLLSWPDNDDAIIWLEKAVETGAATPNQKVYLGQAYYKGKKVDSAISILEEVATMAPSNNRPVEDWEQIKKAKNLLKEYR